MKILLLVLGGTLLLSMGVNAQTNNYTVANIVTSAQDPRLVNPWGLSRPVKGTLKENEWWTSDQGTGFSTLYYANGTIVALAVAVPPAAGAGVGSPTGTVSNPNGNSFAFSTLDGTISLWDPFTTPVSPGPSCMQCHVSTATIMVNHAASGASYQGLTIAKHATSGALTYYAANANGGVEAYDATSFSPVSLPPGAFTDSTVPATYSPAGIQAIGGKIYVTYNKISGGGAGFVTAYDTDGVRLLSLATGKFSQPWGVALAPANFGAFSRTLLVGNTGNGLIGAYNPTTGAFIGFLKSGGVNIALPGLWGLSFGDGNVESGPTNVLYFNTGGPNQTTGVFGSIAAN